MKPSRRARLMNHWLRLTERRHLERTEDVSALRLSFERKAKLSFRGPRGALYRSHVIANTPCQSVEIRRTAKGACLLYFHGGAYVMGSPRTHRAMVAHLCRRTGATAVLPDYRKAPEAPFPAAIEDAVAVYQALLADKDRSGPLVIGGDSAGGGLALALLGEVCRLGLAQPAGTFAFSPLTDLTFSGKSIVQNADNDVVLPASRITAQRREYLQGGDPRDPRASPLFADFKGASPVWLTVGDTEILRDDTIRMADALRKQAVDVTCSLAHDLPHVWPLFHGYFPEAGHTLDGLASWISSLQHR